MRHATCETWIKYFTVGFHHASSTVSDFWLGPCEITVSNRGWKHLYTCRVLYEGLPGVALKCWVIISPTLCQKQMPVETPNATTTWILLGTYLKTFVNTCWEPYVQQHNATDGYWTLLRPLTQCNACKQKAKFYPPCQSLSKRTQNRRQHARLDVLIMKFGKN